MTHGKSRDGEALHAVEGGPVMENASLRSPDLSYLRSVVDRRLGLLLPTTASNPATLHAAMRHILLAPGKRLRPLLAMSAALRLGADEHQVLDCGCALEMIHAASLIIDDLPCMDDATLRRNQPATHVQFGEDVAVLAAISLLTRAYGVVATAPSVPPPARVEILAVFTGAVGSLGLCGGQFDDLRPVPGRSLSATEDVNRRKTGLLFIAAVEAAGLVHDASAGDMEALRDFANHVGRAYQILDDLLDVQSSAATLGKDVGKDEGKATVIASLGASRAASLLDSHLRGALEASDRISRRLDGTDPLRDFLRHAFGGLPGVAVP
ncbi:polyprenyl synthetase family protein [Xanthobacter sp. DSM 24535]|uniref:polyprenyl synthetase family protein n=1 Tax=Roseixanthobacter psychrophilus TaxID=3119917 RepID=UPI00372756D6